MIIDQCGEKADAEDDDDDDDGDGSDNSDMHDDAQEHSPAEEARYVHGFLVPLSCQLV
jgi:hypothetical protein